MGYGERLEQAMRLAGKTRADIARVTGISVQAVGQCLRGETTALTAENSAKAAQCCAVDHYWLATGDGKSRPDRAWPFTLFDQEEYKLIPIEHRRSAENNLFAELQRAKMSRRDLANGTTG